MKPPGKSREPSPLLPHGGYRKLVSYKLCEAVYDATVVFCRRFFPTDRRMTDQMVQAARSGVRNISEGSGAAATSRKTEMKLTNVGRSSLADELLGDYESFLLQNGLRVWPRESPEARAMRERLKQDHAASLPPAKPGAVRLTGLSGLSDFVSKADPELAANAMICVIHQAVYLLNRQLKSQGREFLANGGFTENLYRARQEARAREAATPACPLCSKPMRRRTARQGLHPGQPFWGCSGYPECKGTLPIEPSDKSDRSDQSDKMPRPPSKSAKGTP